VSGDLGFVPWWEWREGKRPPDWTDADEREFPALVEPAKPLELEIVSAEEFASIDESGAGAFVGTPDEALIPEGGDAMFYGDGGAGKTTLAIDLACHLAAGDEWVGIEVGRSVRVLLIENEGPRPRFRRKVKRKLAEWSGSPIDGRLLVLEKPWGKFSYADPGWRQLLAEYVREHQIDVVIVGPLTASGMEAAGTLQETRAFIELVDQVRELAERRFANVLVHHENRGGKVSGAWEGTGDTLVHVQQPTRGRVRLDFRKVRWSSELHGTTLQLVWAEGEGFALAEAEPARPERVWDDIAEFVLDHGGCGWNEVDRAVSGEATYKRRRRDAMLDDGLLVNTGRGQAFELWHRDDPEQPRRIADAVATQSASAEGAGEGP